jgi:putative membrane protein
VPFCALSRLFLDFCLFFAALRSLREIWFRVLFRGMTTITSDNTRTPISVIGAIIGISALASLFLCWLVYYHAPTDVAGTQLLFLPALNALLNALSSIALVAGYFFIRARRISEHRGAMFTAFIFSTVFLVTYITNHALHGDMHFQGQGFVRGVYFPLLISHIALSVVALPMILITFFLSLTGRFPAHRRLARFTFPVWLYVSVTGVIVYAMLAGCR